MQRLRELREGQVLSMRELAGRAGVSWHTVYEIEAGRRKTAQPRTIRKLAEALGVEPRELLKGEEG